jgi:hypothetical protein
MKLYFFSAGEGFEASGWWEYLGAGFVSETGQKKSFV